MFATEQQKSIITWPHIYYLTPTCNTSLASHAEGYAPEAKGGRREGVERCIFP